MNGYIFCQLLRYILRKMPFSSILYSSSLPTPIPAELFNLFHRVIMRNSYALLPLEPYVLSTLIFVTYEAEKAYKEF